MTRLVHLMAAALLVVSCGGGDPSVRGVVVDITGQLDDIESFVLATEDGERFTFAVSGESDFHALPLGHLNEHRVSGAPVIVEYEEEDGSLVVVSLRDG